MDPRSFLPPRAVPTADPPSPGDSAPRLTADGDAPAGAVIAFLRHAGCPFAEATARSLTDAARTRPDVDWIAVSHAPRTATERWCGAVGLSGVDVVVDEDRSRYAAWGLGRSTLGHFLGWRSLRSVASLARRGIRNRHPSGTRWQSAGTFAVDRDGIVRWRHLPSHAGDLPDLEAAADAAAVSE